MLIECRPRSFFDGLSQAPDHYGSLLRNAAIVFTARNICDRPLPLLNDASVNQSYDLLSGFAVRRLLSFGFQKRL